MINKMKLQQNINEIKRSWWYSTIRSIGMFCYKYWWLILLFFIFIFTFFLYFIIHTKNREKYCCIQNKLAQNQLLKLDSLLNNCIGCATQNSIQFDADYIVLTYLSTDGQDLDTRTKMITPNFSLSNNLDYVGWKRSKVWPNYENPILKWSDDNRGIGYESVLINLKNFKSIFPSNNNFIIDTRAFWFSNVGNNPIIIHAVMYKGGYEDGTIGNGDFEFHITDFRDSVSLNSTSKIISIKNISPIYDGDRIATFNYNLATNTGRFDQ